MTTAVNIDEELEAIKSALLPLCELEVTLEEELKEAEAARPTPFNHDQPFKLREMLAQLRQGVPLGQGMDPRLYAVLTREEIARFRFRAPGLGPLLRLQERLVAERKAIQHPAPPSHDSSSDTPGRHGRRRCRAGV